MSTPIARKLVLQTAATLIAAWLTTVVPAQVVVTEVHPGQGWIEVQNRGTAAEDLGDWSVFCATQTPGLPNTYWWPFPATTTLAPGAFLQIHWFGVYQPPTPTEVFTGTSPIDFLFGLGGEALHTTAGAVALLRTQAGAEVADPAMQVDWITWGLPNPPRESSAIAAGLWITGAAAAAPGPTQSLALATEPTAEPTPLADFFLDTTPTPGQRNQDGANVEHYGFDCAVGASNAPTIEVLGTPAVGNPDFAVRTHGSDALLGHSVILLIGFGRGDGQTVPIPQLSCPFWVDLTQPIFPIVLPATPGQLFTDLPLSLAATGDAFVGLTIHVQSLVVRFPLSVLDHAASAGVAVTFGG